MSWGTVAGRTRAAAAIGQRHEQLLQVMLYQVLLGLLRIELRLHLQQQLPHAVRWQRLPVLWQPGKRERLIWYDNKTVKKEEKERRKKKKQLLSRTLPLDRMIAVAWTRWRWTAAIGQSRSAAAMGPVPGLPETDGEVEKKQKLWVEKFCRRSCCSR